MPYQPKSHPEFVHGLDLYTGRWVAVVGELVVGQGGTPEQAKTAALISRPKVNPKIVYVPTLIPLVFPPALQLVADVIPPDLPVYLVGGAVRDALIQRPIHDLDFILPGNALKLSRQIADQLGAAFYPLDDEHDTGRVIFINPDGTRFTMDFAGRRGPDLETDLRGRDFTVNAMAVDLRNPQAILDPLGGASDLLQKRLCPCSQSALINDPIRILRGVRQAAAFGFHIPLETRNLMRQAAPLLQQISPERLRDEIFRLMDGPRISDSVRALDMLGALRYTFPELELLKSVKQSPPHHDDVWEHTLVVIQKLQDVFAVLATDFDENTASNLSIGLMVLRMGKYRNKLNDHLSEKLNSDRSLKSLIFLAALYHDAGKPGTRTVDGDGRIRFIGHDAFGEKIVGSRFTHLRLSNPEIERARLIVRGHLRPLLLENDGHQPTRRAIYRFFREMGPAGIDICILALADFLGTYGTALPQDQWSHHLDVIDQLLEAWWEHPQENVIPPALVNGHDLMDVLCIPPGPEVGQLLEAIREAQAMGQFKSKDEALNFARELHTGQ